MHFLHFQIPASSCFFPNTATQTDPINRKQRRDCLSPPPPSLCSRRTPPKTHLITPVLPLPYSRLLRDLPPLSLSSPTKVCTQKFNFCSYLNMVAESLFSTQNPSMTMSRDQSALNLAFRNSIVSINSTESRDQVSRLSVSDGPCRLSGCMGNFSMLVSRGVSPILYHRIFPQSQHPLSCN